MAGGRAKGKGKGEGDAMVSGGGPGALAHLVETKDGEWEELLPNLFLMAPEQELKLKLKDQMSESVRIRREIEPKVEEKEDLRSVVNAFVHQREEIVKLLNALIDEGAEWRFSSTDLAVAKMKQMDDLTASIDVSASQYVSAAVEMMATDAKSFATFSWVDVSQKLETKLIAFDVANVLLCVSLSYMVLASKVSTGRVGASQSKAGCHIPFARYAYDLLRKSSGMLSYLASLHSKMGIDALLDVKWRDCTEIGILCLEGISTAGRFTHSAPCHHHPCSHKLLVQYKMPNQLR